AQSGPRAAAYNVEASPGSNSSRPLGSSGERCCISCCLQRNFVTSIRPTLIPSDFCSEPVSTEPFVSEPSRNGVPLILSNRAPPEANPLARLIVLPAPRIPELPGQPATCLAFLPMADAQGRLGSRAQVEGRSTLI